MSLTVYQAGFVSTAVYRVNPVYFVLGIWYVSAC